jgi:hypothetical protein
MKPPAQILIGTQVFRVVLRNRSEDGMMNDGSFGYTLDTENLIVIDSSLAETRIRTTLVHELLHAIRMVFDSPIKPKKSDDFESWEHYFIGIYEEHLVLVLRDNPELFEYLKK